MLRHGSRSPVRFLLRPLTLVTLSVIALMVFIFLKKKTILNKAPEILALLTSSFLNESLARYALAQSAHETNGFTSSIFKSNNNLFGMKYAGQKHAAGEKNGYAYYITLNDSVLDLTDWYNRHRNKIFSLPAFINSLSSYVRFLKNNDYFEAPESEYLNGVTYFYNQLFA